MWSVMLLLDGEDEGSRHKRCEKRSFTVACRCQAQYAKKHGGGGRWRDGTGFSWNGSSEFEESDDDMLYIPVESDEDISVRPVDSGESDSSCSSSEEEKREGDDYDNKSDRSRLESDNEGSQSEGRDDGLCGVINSFRIILYIKQFLMSAKRLR